MSQKFESGCKTKIGSTIRSELGVRGCGNILIVGTFISYNITPLDVPTFVFDYGPASTIKSREIENLGLNNKDFGLGDSSTKQFAVFNDQLYGVGLEFLERPGTSPNGYIDRIMKFDRSLLDWVALVPEFIQFEVYNSIAYNAIDNQLMLAGGFDELNNGGAGLAVDDTKNIGGYNGSIYSTVSFSSKLTAFPDFDTSVQLVEFEGSVVASAFKLAAFQPLSLAIYRGNQLWEYLKVEESPGGGTVQSFAVADMTINNIKKDYLFGQNGGTVFYWDGANYTSFTFVGAPTFVTKYKKGIAVCGTFTSIDGNNVSGVAYWDGDVWEQLGDFPFLTGKTLVEHNSELYVSGNFSLSPSGDDLERVAVYDSAKDLWKKGFKSPEDSALRAEFEVNHGLFSLPRRVKLK